MTRCRAAADYTANPKPTPAAASSAGDTFKIYVYPNPDKEHICFAWDQAGVEHMQIAIYNIRGEKVAVLGREQPGNSLRWDSGQAAPGVYLYRAEFALSGQTAAVCTGKFALTR